MNELRTMGNINFFRTRQPVKPMAGITVRQGKAGVKRVLIYGPREYARKVFTLVDMGCMNGLPIMFHYRFDIQSLRVLNQWSGHQHPEIVEQLAQRVIEDHNKAAAEGGWNRDFREYTDWQCIFAGTLPIEEYAYGKVRSLEVLCENSNL